MSKFSLSGFQKVSKTPDTTTLRHPAGHEFTIKHTALSPKLRGDIEALPHVSEKHPDIKPPKAPTVAKFADGTPDTPVQQVETSYNQAAGTEKPQTPEDIARQQKNAAIRARNTTNASGETSASNQTYADGGNVQDLPNGPDAADRRVLADTKASEDKDIADKAAESERSKQAVSQEQESAPKGPGGPDDYDAHKTNAQLLKQQGDNLAAHIQATPVVPGQQPSSTPTVSANPGADQTAAGVNQPTPTQPPVSGQLASQPSSTNDQTQPSQPPADANTTALKQSVNDAQKYVTDSEAKNNQLLQAAQTGKIDPKQYFEKMDTTNRILNVIGLVMGGLGAGATGGKNLAVSTLNEAVQKDIDAQIANKSNSMNLYKMNLEATKNGEEARNMTVNQQLTLVQAALAKQAADTTNQQAVLNLQKTNEDIKALKFQNDANAFQARMRDQIATGAPGSTPLSTKIQYGLPKEQQAEGEKQASEYDSLKRTADNVNQIFDNMEKEQTAGNLANPQSYLRQKQNKAALVQAIMETSPSKRLTKESIEQEIKPFEFGTGSTQQTIDAARKGVLDIVKAHSGPMNLLADRGMIPQLDQITAPSPTKYLNGVPYKLGPDKQYHRVK